MRYILFSIIDVLHTGSRYANAKDVVYHERLALSFEAMSGSLICLIA